jgi:cytochrome c oxidase subunit 2
VVRISLSDYRTASRDGVGQWRSPQYKKAMLDRVDRLFAIQEQGSKVNMKLLMRVLVGVSIAACAGGTWADELNLRQGATAISHDVYGLHMFVLYICCAIGVVVFSAMGYSMYAHRKSIGAVPAQFHENTQIEILWTIIPLLILIGMAVPATKTLIKMYDTGGEDLIVEVRGYQWKWQYKYLDENHKNTLEYFSTLATTQDEIHNKSAKGQYYLLEVDKPLVIPTKKKVRFLITGNDVIHSFSVPDFGIKRDAIPGILNDVWALVDEPGIYRGQCSELCGKDHGFMPIVINAVPEDEYNAWYTKERTAYAERAKMASQTFTAEELMTLGQQVYTKNCAACHQADGKGLPPVFPALAGSKIATGDRAAHVHRVFSGVPGTAMQAFGTQLNAAEIAAVVHYERHSFGNSTDDITQPIDVLNIVSAQ